MEQRAQEFLQLLNEIDEHLKTRVRRREARGFMMRLDQAARQDSTLAKFRDELREYSELRNAIVHYGKFPEEIIAEPKAEVVDHLRMIRDQILRPPRLIPTFASQVRCFEGEEQLLDAFRFMVETDHAQVPVMNQGRLTLLTTDGVGRWFLARMDVDVAATTIAEVLEHERPGSFLILAGHEPVEKARAAFHDSGSRLRAILITERGLDSKPLGIVTASDMLEFRFRQEAR
jgi:CBS domain-containing protein